MKRNLILILLLSIITTSGYTQQFSSEPQQFLKELDKYLTSINREKAKPFIAEFGPFWLTEFPNEYRQKVIFTSNLIVEKRLPAFPDLHGYLLSVYSFVKTNQPKESFESWHKTIDQLLNSKNVKKFQTFIEVCSGFFTDGTIYNTTSHLWGVRSGSYRFEFEQSNPKIYFEDVTLYCYIHNKTQTKKADKFVDSTVVKKTSGVYEPMIFKWTGKGGVVNWEKTGLKAENNYATISGYSMSIKSTKLESDTVEMVTEFYPTPLKGSFVDIARVSYNESDLIYPQFISFSKKIERKTILPEVDYIGGLALNGNSFTGIGYDNEPATLIFYKDGKSFTKLEANRLRINEKGVYATECRSTLYINEKDSVFHPGLNVRYDLHSIEFMRDKDGLAQAPFTDSYHELEIYVDKLIWSKDNDNLIFTWDRGNSNRSARFESKDYFDETLFTQLQGMSKVHPLTSIYSYYYKYDEETFSIPAAASHMGMTNDQAIPILLNLANLGFITYNKTQQTITVLPKTKKYIDSKSNKRDYDDIVFTCEFNPIEKQPLKNPDGSENKQAVAFNARATELNKRKEVQTAFGTMNLKTLDLSLNEVQPVEVSVVKNVVVFPKDGKLVLKENRNFLFEGAISAGKAEVYVNDAAFEYDNFKFFLLDVDAVLFRVRPIFGGSDRLMPMTSYIQSFTGELEVDKPNNKSGNDKKVTDYPKISTKKNSYVYYNHKSIYNGTYDSLTFYFKLDPFEIDSLMNFDEKNMKLSGEFRSSGIFPVFKEELKIQEDYSFGFKTVAPKGGYKFYGDDAKYENDIRLSNNGLRGSGVIDFLTSHTVSEDFVFFKDSTMGISEFTNKGQTKKEGLEVPDVYGKGIMVTYVPKKDILKAKATQQPLYMFNKEVVMLGETKLTPKGMTGYGAMYFGKAEIISKNYNFERWVVNADTADFNLADIDHEKNEEKITMETNNVNARVDFKSRRGEFKNNDGESVTTFPQNEYICYMDMITWLMDSEQIELSKAESEISIDSQLDLTGSNFFSINKDQDSLNFSAPKATVNLKDKIITCEKIKYIDVADARITPPNETIIIRKKAKMDPLIGATIVANYITKYHTITEANVEILARRVYKGTGLYTYKDVNKKEYTFKLEKIGLDTSFQTVATGTVDKNAGFKLSDQFDFYGNVHLKASSQNLTFDGATRINHDCDQFAKNWLKFKDEIDPENIQITVTEDMKDLDGNPISVGLVLRNPSDEDSIGVYPTFLSALVDKDDKILFTSHGFLTYNKEANEFRIASADKLINRAEKGNYISLHTQSCSMNGDGRINIGMDLPDVSFNPVGTISYDMSTKKTSMNISGGLDFFYDKKAMEMNANSILKTEEIAGVDFERTTLEQAIMEDVDKETAENIKGDYMIRGEVKRVPKEMQVPVYLTNIRLEWDNRNKAFISKPISGIVNMYNTPVYKDFTVRLAIKYSVKNADRGDKLMLMIELPPNKYYFYHFEKIKKDTKLQIFTNEKSLQDYLLSLKDDKRKDKKLSFELADKTIYISQFRSLFGE